jgi:hypothetical protein
MTRSITGDEAASDRPIPSHTANASGPDQIANAAGIDADSHGSTSRPSSHNGASDAPSRHASQTPAVTRTTIDADGIESGRRAMRESPALVTASVPCDNHAAKAVARSAATRTGRDTEVSLEGLTPPNLCK